MFDPYNFVTLWGGSFSSMAWVHTSPSREVSNHYKVVLSDCPRPVMRHFGPDGRGSNQGCHFPLFMWHEGSEGSEVWRVWKWCLYATTFRVATSRRHFLLFLFLQSFNHLHLCVRPTPDCHPHSPQPIRMYHQKYFLWETKVRASRVCRYMPSTSNQK